MGEIKKVKEYLFEQDEANAEVYNNWHKSGLLDKLSVLNGYLLAKKLEEMAQLMLGCAGEVEVDTLIFPIVARSYHKHNYLIDRCRLTLNHVISKKSLIGELNMGFGVDGEAEFCALMAAEISMLKL